MISVNFWQFSTVVREYTLSYFLYVCTWKSFSHVWLSATPWTVARQAPLSMGFLRQEYWSGLPFPSPGYLPDPGLKSTSLALAGRFSTTEPPGKLQYFSRPGILWIWYVSYAHLKRICSLLLFGSLFYYWTPCSLCHLQQTYKLPCWCLWHPFCLLSAFSFTYLMSYVHLPLEPWISILFQLCQFFANAEMLNVCGRRTLLAL